MSPRQLNALLIFGAAMVLAVCAGISIATESYTLLAFAIAVAIMAVLIFTPGYIPLLVFGLLMPFTVPVPFIVNCPILLIALGIGILKYWLERGLLHHRKATNFKIVDFSVGLFFGWVLLRYLMKPALPNLGGFGRNVTGFRPYLNYALSFGVLFFFGRFVVNRAGLLKLIRWMALSSVLFIAILAPVALSGNFALATILQWLGMFVAAFGSGIFRFVALPSSGLILLSLLFLPHLLKLSRLGWWCFFILAMAAIFLGGSRSGLALALVNITIILLLRRKFLQFSIIAGLAMLVLGTAYFEGSALSQLSHGALLRAFGLVSPDLAESTGGNDTLQWREDQWQRAWEEIKEEPLMGQGYGGVEGAFEFGAFGYNEETNTEVDLAIGGIHDGYLACALALGVPAALLFIFILGRHTFLNARQAWRLQKKDPIIAEAHCFICANIVATACGMVVGTDANAPIIWFYVAWSLFLFHLRSREKHHPKAVSNLAQPVLAEQLA